MRNKVFFLFLCSIFISCQEPQKKESYDVDRYQMNVIDRGINLRADIFVIDKITGKTYVRDGNSSLWIEIGSPKDAIIQKY